MQGGNKTQTKPLVVSSRISLDNREIQDKETNLQRTIVELDSVRTKVPLDENCVSLLDQYCQVPMPDQMETPSLVLYAKEEALDIVEAILVA